MMEITKFVVFVFIFIRLVRSSDVYDLNISIMTRLPDVDNDCSKAALNMAIEDVNNMEKYIYNRFENTTYKFTPVYKPIDSDVTNSIKTFHRMLYNKQNKTMIGFVGPPYTEQIDYCAPYSITEAVVMVSYMEAYEPLDTVLVFYMQSPPAIMSSFQAARKLMAVYNWTQIAVIYDFSNKRYRKHAENIREEMISKGKHKVRILAEVGIWSDPAEYQIDNEMHKIQIKGAKIIVAMVSIHGARKIFCGAYIRRMIAPKVVWILFEILPKGWASDKYNSLYNANERKVVREVSCSEAQLLEASKGYIAIKNPGLRKDGVKTENNMTVNDFRRRLQKKVKHGVSCGDTAAYAYDSIWVLAGAFKKFNTFPNTASHKTFTYSNFGHTYPFSNIWPLISFEGLTGPFSFKTQIATLYKRIGHIWIWANGSSAPIHVGTHDTKSNKLSMIENAEQILFTDGYIPKDRATVVTVQSTFMHSLVITICIIAGCGVLIVFSLISATFFFSSGSSKVSDITLNGIILFGCMLCYASVIIYGLDTKYVNIENTSQVCWAFVTTLCTGFSLTYGSLFAKAWKLYKLYMTPEIKIRNNQVKRKDVPDWLLLIIVQFFVVLDAIILGSLAKVSPIKPDIRNLTIIENFAEDTVRIEQIVSCTCENQTEFTIGIYCYKGFVLLFGIFLAWQTRNAKIKIQNESKQITLAIYNIVAVSLIGVICVSVLTNTTRHQAKYAIVAVCVFVCTTTTLLLLFLPKLQALYSQITAQNKNVEKSRKYSDCQERRETRAANSFIVERKSSAAVSTSLSTITLTTQRSLEPHASIEQHLQSIGSFSLKESNSITPSFLSASQFFTPPAYEGKEEVKDNHRQQGKLSSSIYDGTYETEIQNADEAKKDEAQ